jgi:hypothetical protein
MDSEQVLAFMISRRTGMHFARKRLVDREMSQYDNVIQLLFVGKA